jgi:hypothetical protein
VLREQSSGLIPTGATVRARPAILLAAVVSLLSLLSSVNCCSRARPRSRRDTEYTPLRRTDILVQIRRQLELVEGAAEFASRV